MQKESLILGVTGVIGSGKSTLCHFLEEKYGFYWIDADKIAHELYKSGQPGYQKIKGYFGKQFVGEKEVLRGRLRQFLLRTPHKIWILNKLMHPLIAHEVNKKIVQRKGYGGNSICIEAAYFEPNDLGKLIDKLIVVDAADETIEKRLKKRKIPLPQLKKLLNFQRKNLRFPGAYKMENSASEPVLHKKCDAFLKSNFLFAPA